MSVAESPVRDSGRGVADTILPLSHAQLRWVNSIGLCQNNGEFVLITALENARLQEPAERNVGPHDPFAAPTCQKALSAPVPSHDRSTNCCCGKGYLWAACFLKTAWRRSAPFHTGQTTFSTNWPWIRFKLNGKYAWRTLLPAQRP